MARPYPKDSQSIANALYLEHHISRIINRQETIGVRFNIRRGRFYIHTLKEQKEKLYRAIRPYLSMELHAPYDRPLSKPFRKDGTHSAHAQAWCTREGLDIHTIAGAFTRVTFEEPNLSKRTRIVTQLLRLGWEPSHFTKKGSPKIAFEGEPCPSLGTIGGTIGQDIRDWYVVRHRQMQIEGLIKVVRSDGRIPAEAITIGTPTFRLRHRKVVNIPRTGTYFGKQMRSLFMASEGRLLVGHDAKGLELRTLAHYIDDKQFTKEVVHGDAHSRNQRDAGLSSRDDAKTFIYAFIYGAGDIKLGSIVRKGRAAGARLRRRFLKANPKLERLIEDVKKAGGRGYLVGLDGRKVTLRKDKFTGEVHIRKALNTLNQSAGTIVMKWSVYLLDSWVREAGLDVWKVIDMHDEVQADVLVKDVSLYSELARQSIITAGKLLNLKVPLDADVKVGRTWAETH